jgi:redox-sensing transcriptional repressor
MAAIPSATLGRLVIYLRVVNQLDIAGIKKTSSDFLARGAQVTPYQVRKDLAHCGKLGTRGTGYRVETLSSGLREFLGLNRPWHVAIVGMGRLGQALAHYPNLDQYDFLVRAFFDVDERKIGTLIAGVEVAHPSELSRLVKEKEIEIGFITVPQEAAQLVADELVEAGVKGILNFAPTVINVPEEVHVEPVDFLAGLKRLSFYIQKPQLKEELA